MSKLLLLIPAVLIVLVFVVQGERLDTEPSEITSRITSSIRNGLYRTGSTVGKWGERIESVFQSKPKIAWFLQFLLIMITHLCTCCGLLLRTCFYVLLEFGNILCSPLLGTIEHADLWVSGIIWFIIWVIMLMMTRKSELYTQCIIQGCLYLMMLHLHLVETSPQKEHMWSAVMIMTFGIPLVSDHVQLYFVNIGVIFLSTFAGSKIGSKDQPLHVSAGTIYALVGLFLFFPKCVYEESYQKRLQEQQNVLPQKQKAE